MEAAQKAVGAEMAASLASQKVEAEQARAKELGRAASCAGREAEALRIAKEAADEVKRRRLRQLLRCARSRHGQRRRQRLLRRRAMLGRLCVRPRRRRPRRRRRRRRRRL